MNLIGCRGGKKGSIFAKIFKNRLFRNNRGDEAETWHTCLGHYLLHRLCFLFRRIRTLVAMVTYYSHRLIMGKEEIYIFFSFSLGIFGFYTEMVIE